MRAFLGETGFVDDEDSAGSVTQVLGNVGTEVVTHLLGIPDSGAEQALDALWTSFTDRLGKLPAILALNTCQ